MSEANARVQKVADQLQRELAVLIQMEIRDPRIGMVSITGVDVSRDLAYAKVYITVMNSLGDDAEVNDSTLAAPGDLDRLEITESLKALEKASGYLRTLLAKRLKLRAVPKLQFRYDNSIERGHRLSNLIDEALAADQKRALDE